MRRAIGQGLYQRIRGCGTEGAAAIFPQSCRLCALPLAAITRYLLLRLTEERLSGDVMKYLGLVLICCAFAVQPAQAFEIQGEKATLEDGGAQLTAPANQFLTPDLSKGSSLALPYIGETDSGLISDYGNAISIPAPGVDKPAPAWALTPSR
jgi:hypothetical protein